LEHLIRTRIHDLYGILNGIDVDFWNPETDPKLVSNYNGSNFATNRPANKRHLQERAGLEVRDDVLLIGLVSRLVWQKGIDLALPALRQMLVAEDVQFVALGTGDPGLEQDMYQLGQDFHWRARTYLQFNDAVAQQIYAGCDLFLMPSHFEPCGMSQMIAMRYGALPLVRETGGLADTVMNYDDKNGDRGTGFVFQWEQPDAVLGTLRWAHNTFKERPGAWRQMQANAMRQDFSWALSARHYIDLYRKITRSKERETTR
jgi:starch synthase